ncbi:hypothetical protein A2J03_15235 [Rhodococcus sp. EPR-157]|uniref:MFS transporter n=1 Tax=Rhodococcus sp. EPR-157 TaxID=1813677 RepID=UPI0007BBFAEC|nr:MFS transporter [Rhodococcus sp. EPR-157]KZF13196.1 hypothetical protein A2J03_15235 [Rhodococcus sp. EPR-157]
MGSALGVLLGFAAFSIVVSATGDNFLTWGWRLPFLATVVLFGLAVYMRLRITESPVMIEAAKNNDRPAKLPFTIIFTQYAKPVALAAGVFAGPFMIQSLLGTFFINYGVTEFGLTRSFLLNASIIGVAFSFVGIPIGGLLADRFGRRRVLAVGVTLATLNLAVLGLLFTGATAVGVIVSYSLVYIFHSLCLAPIGALYSELFPTAVRYTGVGMSYQFSSLIGGGLGPVAASLLIASGLGLGSVFAMLAFSCLVAGYCIYRLPRTDNIDLRDAGQLG